MPPLETSLAPAVPPSVSPALSRWAREPAPRSRASDPPGAIVALEKELAAGPHPVEAAALALQLGRAWTHLGAPAEAEPWLRRVADDEGAATPAQRREALISLARAAEADPTRAQPHLVRLLDLLDDAPTDQADVRLELARCHIAQRDPALALAQLDHVRADLVPHLTPAHLVRVEHLTGAALHAAHRPADALVHLQEAARHERDPSRRAHLSLDIGDALAALGSHALAQRQYATAQAWAVDLAQPDLVLLACQRRIDHAAARRDWAEVAALQPLAATWSAVRHERDLDRQLTAQQAICAVRVRRVEEVQLHGAREALAEAASRATALQAQLSRAMAACEAAATASERAEGLRAACLETLEHVDATLRPTLESVAQRDPEAIPAVDAALAALDHARARHRAVGRPLAPPIELAERLGAIATEVATTTGARVTVVVRSGTPHRVRVHEAALRSAVRALLLETAGDDAARGHEVRLLVAWSPEGLRLAFYDDHGTPGAMPRAGVAPDHPALRVAAAERAWLGGTLTSRADGRPGPRHALTLPVSVPSEPVRPTTLVEDIAPPRPHRAAR